MAFKKYAYYNKGNKFALVESEMSGGGGKLAVAHCTLSDYTTKTTCEAAGGQWIPSSSGSSTGVWEKYISPKEAVTDGIELEYAYVLTYRVNDADDTVAITAYTEASGLLSLTVGSSSFTADQYIVITGSSKWNGLHQVNAAISSATALVLKTKYNYHYTYYYKELCHLFN